MALNSCVVFICSKCRVNVFKTPAQSSTFLFPSRGYRWKAETHYDVLGVHPDATQAEIKTAYLTLSKELHPDLNQRVTKQDKELIHQQFVKVNQAYSILGNKRDRRTYDLEVLIKTDPRGTKDGSQGGDSGRVHAFRDRPMTFEERAKAMGYAPQDPNFYKKHKDYHKKILLACFVWIVGGAIFSRMVIMALYQRHTTEMDLATKKNNEILVASRNNAMQYGSVEERTEAMRKKWGEEQVKFDEKMKKRYET